MLNHPSVIVKSPSFRHGLAESSAMEGNLPVCMCFVWATCQPANSLPCDWVPAVHAGTTCYIETNPPSFRHGLAESSAMEGNLPVCMCFVWATCQPANSLPCDWVPAVHAGTTGLNRRRSPGWLSTPSFPLGCGNPEPRTVTGRLQQCLAECFCNVADSPPCDWVPAVHAGTTVFF